MTTPGKRRAPNIGRAAPLLILLLTLTAATLPQPAGADAVQEWILHVAPTGVEVRADFWLEEGLNTIPLPTIPVPETIEVLLNGSLIPAIYDEEANTIYTASPAPGNATLIFLAQVVEQEGALQFNITPTNTTIKLVIDPGVILLDIPPTEDVALEGNLLILTLTPTNTTLTIPYVITQAITPATQTAAQTPPQPETPPPTPTTQTPRTTSPPPPTQPETPATPTTTATPTPTPSQTTVPQQTQSPPPTTTQPPTPTSPAAQEASSPQPPAGEEPQEGAPLTLALALAMLGVVGLAAALYLKRRPAAGSGFQTGSVEEAVPEPEERPPEELDDTDRLILETLRRAGGVMMQSRLMRVTGLPKTSLWRRVKRLEQWGYLRVEREGKSNKIILVRAPEEGGGGAGETGSEA